MVFDRRRQRHRSRKPLNENRKCARSWQCLIIESKSSYLLADNAAPQIFLPPANQGSWRVWQRHMAWPMANHQFRARREIITIMSIKRIGGVVAAGLEAKRGGVLASLHGRWPTGRYEHHARRSLFALALRAIIVKQRDAGLSASRSLLLGRQALLRAVVYRRHRSIIVKPVRPSLFRLMARYMLERHHQRRAFYYNAWRGELLGGCRRRGWRPWPREASPAPASWHHQRLASLIYLAALVAHPSLLWRCAIGGGHRRRRLHSLSGVGVAYHENGSRG